MNEYILENNEDISKKEKRYDDEYNKRNKIKKVKKESCY